MTFLSRRKNQHEQPDVMDFTTVNGFSHVYEKYARFVYSICASYIKNEADCDDLTAKIFLSLWERRDSLVITGPIKHYLARAAKLQVFDYFKLEQRREERVNKAVNELGLFGTTIENEVWYQDLRQHLNKALEQLPSQRKEVFKLIKLEGCSIKEAAKKLMVSENTIKTHLSKAVQQLRTDLNEFSFPMRSTGS